MAKVPLWRKRISVRHYSEIREELGIWICGSNEILEVLPASMKAVFGGNAGYYSLLSQRVADGYISLSKACLYYNPTTGARKLLLTGAEFMCDEVSDVRMFCSGSLQGCDADVAVLCPLAWLDIFRKLEKKGLIPSEQCAEICSGVGTGGWHP